MPSDSYSLAALSIQGFRAFLKKQEIEFRSKTCLAVFAPNGYGKSSIVDALEFLFSESGTLQRLGLRAINNQAGPTAMVHVAAEAEGIDSLVSVSFIRSNVAASGTRRVTGQERPCPAIVEQVKSGLLVDPLIRGYELRQFVEQQTPEERYENVARWLQLDPLVYVQRNLRSLRFRMRAEANDRSATSSINAQVARLSSNRIREWDQERVLEYCNSLLASLDAELSVSSLSVTDPGLAILSVRAVQEAQALGLDGLIQLQGVIRGLDHQPSDGEGSSEASGLISEFAAAVREEALARDAEAVERASAANTVFSRLWEEAELLFAGSAPALETCPLCSTPLEDSPAGDARGVLQHLTEHRAELAAYSAARQRLEAAVQASRQAHSQLLSALRHLGPLAAHRVSVVTTLQDYLGSVEAWSGGPPPSPDAFRAALRAWELEASMQITALQEASNVRTYAAVKRQVDAFAGIWRENEQRVARELALARVIEELDAQASFITTSVRGRVQTLLDTLQEPVNRLYRQIQGGTAVAIRLELPHEEERNQQRLALVVDFSDNRAGVQPSGYLSDSQIHSVALALRLAAIKTFNSEAPIVVLDDVVTSYDADHRRTIVAMLAQNFADHQLLITTHDERFFIYLKDQLPDRDWRFVRIGRLEAGFGPRFLDHKVDDDLISAKWDNGESAANEIRQAEEEWLLQLARDLGVKVQIRTVDRAYVYERSELADAIAQYFKDRSLIPPLVPGVNNRFLSTLQRGVVENFGSHFADSPHGSTSFGDERARWDEFRLFRSKIVCSSCGHGRFKRPALLTRAVCAKDGCETPLSF